MAVYAKPKWKKITFNNLTFFCFFLHKYCCKYIKKISILSGKRHFCPSIKFWIKKASRTFYYSPHPPFLFLFLFHKNISWHFFLFLFFAKIVGNNPSLVPRNVGANLCYLCFICIPAFHESPSWLCWGCGSAKTLNKYDSHCCLMLVQIFLASAERGTRRRWARVCGPKQNLGRSLPFAFPTSPNPLPLPPPQPFYEIRQRGRWKTAGPFLWVFNQKWYSTVLTGYCEVQAARIVKMSTETLQAVYLKTVGLLDFVIYFCSALHKWKKIFFNFFKKIFL